MCGKYKYKQTLRYIICPKCMTHRKIMVKNHERQRRVKVRCFNCGYLFSYEDIFGETQKTLVKMEEK